MGPGYSALVKCGWCCSKVHSGPQSNAVAAWQWVWCKVSLQLQEWTSFHFFLKAHKVEVVSREKLHGVIFLPCPALPCLPLPSPPLSTPFPPPSETRYAWQKNLKKKVQKTEVLKSPVPSSQNRITWAGDGTGCKEGQRFLFLSRGKIH